METALGFLVTPWMHAVWVDSDPSIARYNIQLQLLPFDQLQFLSL